MPDPSARRLWTAVLVCFVALAAAFSARATLGLVLPTWVGVFGWSRTGISAIGAATLVVMAGVAPLAGRLVDRFGPRVALGAGLSCVAIGCAIVAGAPDGTVLVLGFAGIAALGFGMVATHVVSTAIVQIAQRRRGLALGVATSGATAGQFVILPLAAWVISDLDWRWGFALLAGLALVLVPLLWRLLPPGRFGAARTAPAGLRRDVTELLRAPAFHALFWSFLLCGYTTAGIIEVHLLPYAALCGFAPLPSATAYGVLSAVNLAGMITAGWLADRVSRPALLAGIYLLRAASFLLLLQVGTSYDRLIVFAAAFGMVDYATVPVTASLVASRLGVGRMGLAMGVISSGHAVGAALGAFLGGALSDRFGSYAAVWWSGFALSLLAGWIVLPLLLSDRRPAGSPAPTAAH